MPKASTSNEPNTPANVGEPTKVAGSAKPAEPAKPAKPAEPAKPAKPTKPAERIFTPRFVAGFAVNFILYMQYYALMVAMAGYSAMQFAAGATEGGFTASVFILGALCARLFFAGAIDKIGRGKVLIACMTGEVACTLLYLAFEHVPAIGVFIALRFLHGAFYGLSQTTVTSIVSESIPFSRKGEGVGYYMLSVTLGAALGPLLGSAFSNAGDFDALFFACIGMIAVGYFAALMVVTPGRVKRKTGKALVSAGVTQSAFAQKESIQAGDVRAGSVAGQSKAHGAQVASIDKTSGKSAAVSAAESPRSASRKRKISLSNFIEVSALPVSVAITVGYLAYGALITYINPYAAEVGLTDAAGFFFVAYSIAMFVTRPFTGRWFDSAGDKGIMTLGYACLAASMLIMGFAQNGAMLLAAAALAGVGVGSVQPNGLVLAMRGCADDRLTAANSTYFVLLDVAIGLCPILLGWIAPAFGYRTLFLVMVPVVAASYVIYMAFRRAGLIVAKGK